MKVVIYLYLHLQLITCLSYLSLKLVLILLDQLMIVFQLILLHLFLGPGLSILPALAKLHGIKSYASLHLLVQMFILHFQNVINPKLLLYLMQLLQWFQWQKFLIKHLLLIQVLFLLVHQIINLWLFHYIFQDSLALSKIVYLFI